MKILAIWSSGLCLLRLNAMTILQKNILSIVVIALIAGIVYALLGFFKATENQSAIFEQEPKSSSNKNNFWPLIDEAVKSDDLEALTELLDEIDLGMTKEDGTTLLHLAIYHDSPKVIDLLLNEGADISTPAVDGTTPIMFAVYNGNSELVQNLYEKGANLEYYTTRGVSPLMTTCILKESAAEMIKLLHKNGVDINRISPANVTPLEFAASVNNIGAFDALLELGAKILVNKEGDQWSAVKWAHYYHTNLQDPSYINLLEAALGTEELKQILSQLALESN